MTSTKITTPVVELNNNAFVCHKRVTNWFKFAITQPTSETIIAGFLEKKPNFAGANWHYRHIDCQNGECLTRFKYDKNVSTKDFRDEWKTQYFYNGVCGFAIIGEEQTRTHNQETEPKQTVIYYNVKVSTGFIEGRIQLDEGILPNQITVKFDPNKSQLNLVVIAADNTLTRYGFSQDKIASGNPLSLSDADCAMKTHVNHWLGQDSISPDGRNVLVYNSDGDYCQLLQLETGELDDRKFAAHDSLFGTHTINWLADPELRIIVDCYSGQLVFELTTGQSEFIKQKVQIVSVRFATWKYTYSSDNTRTIRGLQWRMPNGVRAQPHLTFELDSILFKDEYDPRYGRTNKSIPRGNIGLDATLMFENDFVAMFLIGARTVIGFDKLLQHSPVVYQLSEKFAEYTICAITQDRITAYLIAEDDYEEHYGYYGDINIINFPYQYANRIAGLTRLAKVPGIPFGASRAISKFLSHQKKD